MAKARASWFEVWNVDFTLLHKKTGQTLFHGDRFPTQRDSFRGGAITPRCPRANFDYESTSQTALAFLCPH